VSPRGTAVEKRADRGTVDGRARMVSGWLEMCQGGGRVVQGLAGHGMLDDGFGVGVHVGDLVDCAHQVIITQPASMSMSDDPSLIILSPPQPLDAGRRIPVTQWQGTPSFGNPCDSAGGTPAPGPHGPLARVNSWEDKPLACATKRPSPKILVLIVPTLAHADRGNLNAMNARLCTELSPSTALGGAAPHCPAPRDQAVAEDIS
jgi:hypothetical protein